MYRRPPDENLERQRPLRPGPVGLGPALGPISRCRRQATSDRFQRRFPRSTMRDGFPLRLTTIPPMPVNAYYIY